MDDPIRAVWSRLINAAMLNGTGFLKCAYDADKKEFLFNIIPNDQVVIKYEKRDAE